MDWLKFAVVVEKDENGYYVCSVPELPGCHTQAKTLDELARRVEEAIEAFLEKAANAMVKSLTRFLK